MLVETPGVGLLGYAFMGRAHAHALLTLGHMTGPPPIRPRLVSVAGRDEAQRVEFAERFGFERHAAAWEDVVADPDVEIVENLLPNNLHAAPVIAAARAGKHVLCEKPLALAVDDVDRMAAAAGEGGVVVAEAFMYRHHPQTAKVRELVRSGAIGTLRLVRGSFTFALSRPEDVRLDPALGGGCLWDVGCYPVSYARLLAGAEPAEVMGWAVRGPTGVDEAFTGHMRFAAGPGQPDVLAQFDCGFRMPYRTHVEAVGSEGVIAVARPYRPLPRETVTVTRGDEVTAVDVEGPEPYRGEVEDMADAVLLGRAPRVSLGDSRGNVAALVALLRSAEEGRPVRVV